MAKMADEGLSPRDATIAAMDEVTDPVIAIALVLSAVFVPVSLMSGLTGQFYRQFALTLSISVLISAWVRSRSRPRCARCCCDRGLRSSPAPFRPRAWRREPLLHACDTRLRRSCARHSSHSRRALRLRWFHCRDARPGRDAPDGVPAGGGLRLCDGGDQLAAGHLCPADRRGRRRLAKDRQAHARGRPIRRRLGAERHDGHEQLV